MLVLARKVQQTIVLEIPASETPTQVSIIVTDIRSNKACIGVTAPVAVRVLRGEILEEVEAS